MNTNTHAFLAPSSAGLTVNCHAAPRLQSFYPEDETSPEAMEGTAAHWVNEERLHGVVHAVGDLAPNGVPVTQEMIEGAELVAEAIGGLDVQIETRLHGKSLHPIDNWGTPDYFRVDTAAKVLFVWDYKFGHGFVDEFENWQLINYASLILDETQYRDLRGWTCHLTVIQPRCYTAVGPVRTWTVKASDLVPYWDRLRAAYYAATEPDPVATPGAWCNNHYCRARHACTALQRSAYWAAGQSRVGTRQELTPVELGTELRILEEAKGVLDARIDGLKEQALSMAMKGQNIAHYAVGWSKPRQRWAKPDAEVIALGELMGVKLAKPPAALTPMQAVKAGLPEALLKSYSETPKGEARLERSTLSQARRVFGGNI